MNLFDEQSVPQQEKYSVLSEEERAKGFVRPYRESYIHLRCKKITSMSKSIAETYAANPEYYVGTYCTTCQMHRPLIEFNWVDENGNDIGEMVGS